MTTKKFTVGKKDYVLSINPKRNTVLLERMSPRSLLGRKVIFYCSFKSREKLDIYITDYIKGLLEAEDQKKKRKKLEKIRLNEMKSKIKVGDIFANSRGWEQTNVDFRQVVSRTKGTVTVREIAGKSVEATGPMSVNVVPRKDQFITDANGNYKEMTKRITKYGISFKYGGSEIRDTERSYHKSRYA